MSEKVSQCQDGTLLSMVALEEARPVSSCEAQVDAATSEETSGKARTWGMAWRIRNPGS
jgi:hypothetical protein